MDALADRWGDRVNDSITKTLWAELNLPLCPADGKAARLSEVRAEASHDRRSAATS
ncbi:hypothetical protein [Streptomyces spirodelae]|uniref:hypothetical protein n=1 Tax=Streptomyces spirodelae TaxID=2812904 RepID=UPI0027DD75AF|nr:hypothetical protein [Streptomyces spirodelae]